MFWGTIFSTCGKTAAPGVNLVKREFNVSHGAIAGTESNDGGSKTWMENFLRSEGVILEYSHNLLCQRMQKILHPLFFL